MIREELETLYAECASALDDADWDRWAGLFAERCSYRVTTKENVDRGYALSLMSCATRGMLLDRVYALKETQFYIPRVFRRIYGGVRLVTVDAPLAGESNDLEGVNGAVHAGCSFAVFETRVGEHTNVFAAGRFIDVVCREGDRLRFFKRTCILDSALIPNSLPCPL